MARVGAGMWHAESVVACLRACVRARICSSIPRHDQVAAAPSPPPPSPLLLLSMNNYDDDVRATRHHGSVTSP